MAFVSGLSVAAGGRSVGASAVCRAGRVGDSLWQRAGRQQKRVFVSCVASVEGGESASTEEGDRHVDGKGDTNTLILRRSELRPKSKLKRTTSLKELGLEKLGPGESPVNVSIMVKKVRSDYYVHGTVKSRLTCTCDRCGKEYEHRGKGTVELWLATSPTGEPALAFDGDTRADESVELFGPDVQQIDLTPHIADGVIIALPNKKLCSSNCRGDLPPGGLPEGLAVEFLPSPNRTEVDDEEEQSRYYTEEEMMLMDEGEFDPSLVDPNAVEPLEHKLDPSTIAMLKDLERELRKKDK